MQQLMRLQIGELFQFFRLQCFVFQSFGLGFQGVRLVGDIAGIVRLLGMFVPQIGHVQQFLRRLVKSFRLALQHLGDQLFESFLALQRRGVTIVGLNLQGFPIGPLLQPRHAPDGIAQMTQQGPIAHTLVNVAELIEGLFVVLFFERQILQHLLPQRFIVLRFVQQFVTVPFFQTGQLLQILGAMPCDFGLVVFLIALFVGRIGRLFQGVGLLFVLTRLHVVLIRFEVFHPIKHGQAQGTLDGSCHVLQMTLHGPIQRTGPAG
mmetsp:Transcript_30085/g.82630  ORF Transcript_30085/g.82630 Transcript_30085/m.82630 type:complete len:263 (+) Transcript_30085:1328-2116(+)